MRVQVKSVKREVKIKQIKIRSCKMSKEHKVQAVETEKVKVQMLMPGLVTSLWSLSK